MHKHRFSLLLLAMATAPAAIAQDLTLERALALAKANNGTVRSSYLQYEASSANARSAFSSYYPTVVPSYQYETSRINTLTGLNRGAFDSVSSDSIITANWLLFDSGERDASYRRSAYSRDGARESALQTLRNVLFGVHSSFYETLRADELLIVRLAQLERAEEILKQATVFAETGAGARKDILQAKADALNAKASELTARNRVSNSHAGLKAILGLEEGEELSTLVSPQEGEIESVEFTLKEAMDYGLANRTDLVSQRFSVQSQELSVRLASLDKGFSWTVDARYSKAFSQNVFESSALVFQFSIPLFDGFRTQENLRSSNFVLDAGRATLKQSERDALAEIESAYKEFAQNLERLDATRAAREASQVNYQAVFESRKEGASDLIELLTAQVSLVTADSNYIEAFYDTLISRARLDLVTGRQMPGEQS